MSNMKFLAALMFGLFIASPVFAQDDAPVADEPVAEEVATDEAAADDAAPAEEAAVAPAEEGEADAEPAEEAGEEEAPAEGEEAALEETPDIEDMEEAIEEAFALVDAIKSKNWPLAVGLGLMILVFILNKVLNLKEKVGPKALPWIAMGFAVAGTMGTGLIAGLGWVDSIVQGVLAGVVAIGGWELIFKHLLGGSSESEDAA